MKELKSTFVFLTIVFPLVNSYSSNDFPIDTCSIEKESCEIHKDNLIESFIATDEDECRQRCGQYLDCQYFSYFGMNNFPTFNYCMLFSSCSVLEYCGEDCYTEDKLCGSCGRNFESRLGDNVIEWIPDVEEEWSCKGFCLADAGCLYYTYYRKESEHYPNLCILLSNLFSPSQECEHCVTSLPNCNNTAYISCKFTIDSDQYLHDSVLFTNVDDIIDVTFSPSAVFGCKATVIAIGGGGHGGGHNGSAGSGYVKSDVIDVSSTGYQVRVGQSRQGSFIQKKSGQFVIAAHPGGDGVSTYRGGDGYSGGGGQGTQQGAGSRGGSDGSDGGGIYGGKGSGFNISTISLEHFILSPGDGGETYDFYFGGGGGGVLVDNVGPDSQNVQGKGYGGGGGAYEYQNGLQGMVLIETKSKT